MALKMGSTLKIKYPGISGNLKAYSSYDEDKKVTIVSVYGDKEGLISLAKLLLTLAEVDQTMLASLPDSGASEHVHLVPNRQLAAKSCELVVGRLDDKMGKFDSEFKGGANVFL